MRPIIAVIVVAGLLSGIFAYTRFVERIRPTPPEYVAEFVAGQYSVRLNRTFDCIADEFSGAESLLVTFNGNPILERSDSVSKNERLVIDLEKVEVGRNEVSVVAKLGDDLSFDFGEKDDVELGASDQQALRIQILNGQNVIAEGSFWVDHQLNELVESLTFLIDASQESEHDHE